MKTQRNILIAFVLNLAFSVFEFFGGFFTGSTAIMSDAVHDLGDAISIGISYFLEKKSRQKPDETYTYGYARYSVLGGIITTVILVAGSVLVILEAVNKIFHPSEIHYDGMIIFAVIGLVVNFAAAWLTREGDSINQKAVNLHMLEDVLGWAVVLAGAIIMRFTGFAILDPLMSIGVSVFILYESLKNLTSAMDLFFDKVPKGLSVEQVKNALEGLPGVISVHHIHVWSLDGEQNLVTVHLVTNQDTASVKAQARAALDAIGVTHSTIETETEQEAASCDSITCDIHPSVESHAHHHH